MLLSSLSLFLILSHATASVLRDFPLSASRYGTYEVIETLEQAPNEWIYRGPARDTDLLNLKIMVKSDADTNLEAKLISISHPDSPEYGNHLNSKQLVDFVAHGPDTVESLLSWLGSYNGISKVRFIDHTSSISFTSTVETANKMLDTKFGIFQRTEGGAAITRSLNYSLPQNIQQYIALVHPVTYFPASQSRSPVWSSNTKRTTTPLHKKALEGADPTVLAACNAGIYPTCIATMYNITYTPPPTCPPSGSKLGIASFLDQWINHTDITSFISKYSPSASTRANPGTFTIELVNNGTNNESSFGIEATLDMEYSMPFTGSLPVVFYSTGSRGPNLDPDGNLLPTNESGTEPYLEWLEYMLAKPDSEIPQVISISYTDTEQEIPRSYAEHVCTLFGRLALRGVSIIDASGDGGVAGQGDVDCISNDGEKRKTFLPTFPASCPWVTAVGSTSIIPEQGSDFSSGGFSNYFPVPEYQRNATSAYISYLDGQYEGLYNSSGRGIPDIAVYGQRYETENNNQSSGHHSGTSAGTPVFAAMVALVNDMRLRAGKPVLGWLNERLYSAEVRAVWNDVTEGNSYGCDSMWNATVGWDAVTGLGSPDFLRLAEALG